MLISIFDLFSIGIGPSSSHTVGPMRAARQYLLNLKQRALLNTTQRLQVDLYGSLALTGRGHGTFAAVLNGLEGQAPEQVIPSDVVPRMHRIQQQHQLNMLEEKLIRFDYAKDFLIHTKKQLPYHSNGMTFSAFNDVDDLIFSETYYSVGGGFILNAEDIGKEGLRATGTVPFPFDTSKQLLQFCETAGLTIDQVMLANESTQHPPDEIRQRLLHIAHIMQECIEIGCHTEGTLPGGLNIPRRAAGIYKTLKDNHRIGSPLHADVLSCLNAFAIAVNEENANGGRIITAPTNGAAGIIPAILGYFKLYHKDSATDDAIIKYLLTAAAIAILYKKGASISGAEVGCQGEVGVACSMAAGALTAVLGGSIYQIENAAEIAMEHHLGMTCDPIAGLVQIPCIERNAMGAVKALNAALLALSGDGKHYVSLDKVIHVMNETGKDMKKKYKETSMGGLAIHLNQPEC